MKLIKLCVLGGLIGSVTFCASGCSLWYANPSSTVGSAEPSRSPSPSLDASLQLAIRFREEFGLRSDLEYVLMVASDPQSVMDFGVPLLPAEASELESRNAMATTAVPLIEDYGARNPDVYAGVFQDQQAEGTSVISFTEDLDYHVPRILGELLRGAPGALVRFRDVEHNEAELNALLDRISSDVASWSAEGIEIVFAGVDIASNNVEVDVLDAPSDAEERLTAEYGSGWIHVVPVDEPPSV